MEGEDIPDFTEGSWWFGLTLTKLKLSIRGPLMMDVWNLVLDLHNNSKKKSVYLSSCGSPC